MSGGKVQLRVKDVVVFNVCAIVSLRWIAPAAHAGSGSLLLFVLAALFFLLPSGIIIARLSHLFPQDGGLYVWVDRAFGPRHAFLCSWLYFISNLFYFPSLVLFAVSTAAYIAGPSGARLAESTGYAIPATVALLWALFLASYFGLQVARGIQTAGTVAIGVIFALVLAFAVMALRHGTSATPFHLLPAFDWDGLNLFSVIAFAFVGLELAPILSGDIQHPGRTIRRSAIISGAICLLFYLAGTGALLVLVKAGGISPIVGLVQAGSAAGGAQLLAALIIFAVAAQLATWITGNTRLPYVIGLDRHLPPAFAKLHPRWRTPYFSLLFQAGVATLVLLMAQLGETVRATYQIMLDMLVLVTFVPFIYIFAAGWRFSTRLAAISGLAVTLLSIGLSLLPPAGVSSALLYELKVCGGLIVMTIAGLAIYHRYQHRPSLEVLTQEVPH